MEDKKQYFGANDLPSIENLQKLKDLQTEVENRIEKNKEKMKKGD